MPAVAPGALDGLPQECHHRRVALVEVEGDHLAVAVDAQRELGQVVGADREAVEALGELVDQDDVVGDLAHHVDLEPVLAALEPVLGHRREHPVGLVEAAAERDHDLDVLEAHLLAHPAHRRALQREGLAIGRVGVARGAAEADHRVLLARLEGLAAEQAAYSLVLKSDRRTMTVSRPEGGGDGADALGEPVDEVVPARGPALDHGRDRAPRRVVGRRAPDGAAPSDGP